MKEQEIIEDEIIDHRRCVEYECSCGKRTSTPKILIVKRVGKGRYYPIEWFCSEECNLKSKVKKII